jgi:hypothetical protein
MVWWLSFLLSLTSLYLSLCLFGLQQPFPNGGARVLSLSLSYTTSVALVVFLGFFVGSELT